MKKILIILSAVLYFSSFGFRIDAGEYDWNKPVSGFIDIVVESNINSLFFSYPFNEISINDQDKILPEIEDTETANIIVPVKDFRCTNKTALDDFQNLLKADQFPNLTIAIPQKVLLQPHYHESVTLHNITINIAGISKKYDIICRNESLNANDLFLVGTIKIRLEDLKIEPPIKFFGLVKIKDEVIVKFGLSIGHTGESVI